MYFGVFLMHTYCFPTFDMCIFFLLSISFPKTLLVLIINYWKSCQNTNKNIKFYFSTRKHFTLSIVGKNDEFYIYRLLTYTIYTDTCYTSLWWYIIYFTFQSLLYGQLFLVVYYNVSLWRYVLESTAVPTSTWTVSVGSIFFTLRTLWDFPFTWWTSPW